jgi:succinate-semialdehyde dehydrogenase/glutarate-semialdehyde dehydrogenase
MKKSINPYNGELLYEFDELSAVGLEEKLEIAEKAFHNWRKTNWDERTKYLKAAAKILKGNSTEYAKTISLEMGKPIKQAVAEVEKF